VYDEDALRADGKAGVLKSMKGRVEDLGGAMQVTSAQGKGTEIELSVPVRRGGPVGSASGPGAT
jgi:signal transduction histidine kinase